MLNQHKSKKTNKPLTVNPRVNMNLKIFIINWQGKVALNVSFCGTKKVPFFFPTTIIDYEN